VRLTAADAARLIYTMLLAGMYGFENLWLVPHVWAVMLGATFWIFRRRRFRISLRGTLLVLAVFALFAAATRHVVEDALQRSPGLDPLEFWRTSGIPITVPVTLIAAVLYCRFFYILVVDRCEPKA
jgi:hypothetical protein